MSGERIMAIIQTLEAYEKSNNDDFKSLCKSSQHRIVNPDFKSRIFDDQSKDKTLPLLVSKEFFQSLSESFKKICAKSKCDDNLVVTDLDTKKIDEWMLKLIKQGADELLDLEQLTIKQEFVNLLKWKLVPVKDEAHDVVIRIISSFVFSVTQAVNAELLRDIHSMNTKAYEQSMQNKITPKELQRIQKETEKGQQRINVAMHHITSTLRESVTTYLEAPSVQLSAKLDMLGQGSKAEEVIKKKLRQFPNSVPSRLEEKIRCYLKTLKDLTAIQKECEQAGLFSGKSKIADIVADYMVVTRGYINKYMALQVKEDYSVQVPQAQSPEEAVQLLTALDDMYRSCIKRGLINPGKDQSELGKTLQDYRDQLTKKAIPEAGLNQYASQPSQGGLFAKVSRRVSDSKLDLGHANKKAHNRSP